MSKQRVVKKPTNNSKTVKKTVPGKGLTANERMKDRDILDAICNTVTSRSQLIKTFLDPRRSINDECGYPDTDELTPEDYRELYDREPIAARVVEVLPKESWKITPRVFETEDLENDTPFEIALRELSKNLGGKGWYIGKQGDPLWSWLERVDVLSGVGSYGVLFLGLDDGLSPLEPAAGLSETGENVKTKEQKLLFIRTYDESLARITAFETDNKNPRFGQPTKYQITINDLHQTTTSADQLPTTTIDVHWTRIVHIADNRGSSQLFGIPRMLAVLNRLLDLRKLYAGSAEMYWRGAFPGLSLESHPQLGPDVIIDADSMRTTMEKYMNGLQRYLQLSGMSAKMLAPVVVDPTPQIDTQIEAICIQKAIPKRVFIGSERGELASTQDSDTWEERVDARRNNYLTPEVIVPVIDRFICLAVLPEPKEYNVDWPSDESLSETEQATVAVQRTESITKYVQGGGEALITPVDFLVRVLGFEEEVALEIIEQAMNVEDDERLTTESVLEEEENTHETKEEEDGKRSV